MTASRTAPSLMLLSCAIELRVSPPLLGVALGALVGGGGAGAALLLVLPAAGGVDGARFVAAGAGVRGSPTHGASPAPRSRAGAVSPAAVGDPRQPDDASRVVRVV